MSSRPLSWANAAMPGPVANRLAGLAALSIGLGTAHAEPKTGVAGVPFSPGYNACMDRSAGDLDTRDCA